MAPSEPKDQDVVPDASDVVDGPIGSAWLKDPATSGPTGADLDALPTIEGPTVSGDGDGDSDGDSDQAIDRP